MKNPVLLKDTMNNLCEDSGASDDYCKGIVVGVVGTLMASGLTFDKALDTLTKHLPSKKMRSLERVLPLSWLESASGKEGSV